MLNYYICIRCGFRQRRCWSVCRDTESVIDTIEEWTQESIGSDWQLYLKLQPFRNPMVVEEISCVDPVPNKRLRDAAEEHYSVQDLILA